MWYFAGGDAGFYFAEQLKAMSWLPVVWRTEFGFGESSLFRMWFDYPYQLFIKLLSSFGLSWGFIDKILWLTVLAFGIYSSYTLGKYILKKKLPAVFTSLIYLVNTYNVLLFAGGQVGVALAYAFSPYVLFRFMRSVDSDQQSIKNVLLDGISLALLIAFDLRLSYIVLGIFLLYQFIMRKIRVQNMVIAFLLTSFIHAFWILPTILTSAHPSQIGEDFTNPGMLKFLSVADFSHTLSLLHPNWPENLFGKVYFLQPEFLFFPFIAFVSLLFLGQTKNKKHILFFSLLALAGAFLSKGVNDPFGNIFNWLFTYVPGFVMFRDPTKFYLLTALGYSILIPFVLMNVQGHLWKKKILPYILFCLFLLITIRSALTGSVKGNLQPLVIPQEYNTLKNQLVQDSIPSRVLWMPQKENFSYYSEMHPFLNASQLFKNISIADIPEIATSAGFMLRLTEAGVKYVIVPRDVEGKLFMSNYIHDDSIRQGIVSILKQTELKQNAAYSDIAVFENSQFKQMVLTDNESIVVQQKYAIIGVFLSAVSLIIAIILILCL